MKIIKQFSIMMAVVLLSFSINSCKQTYHTITLHVDTSRITQKNIDSTCHFGPRGVLSNKDFTTFVEAGDKIIWGGVSSSSPKDDIVKIEKIQYISGDTVLNKLELIGKKSVVVGKVRRKGKIGDSGKYLIQFTVFDKRTKRNEIFTIDPKLEVIVR